MPPGAGGFAWGHFAGSEEWLHYLIGQGGKDRWVLPQRSQEGLHQSSTGPQSIGQEAWEPQSLLLPHVPLPRVLWGACCGLFLVTSLWAVGWRSGACRDRELVSCPLHFQSWLRAVYRKPC